MKRIKISVETDEDGAATVFGPKVSGTVHSVHYAKDATDAFADGVDFTLTAETTGHTIWAESNVNASAVRYPRAVTHGVDGSAALFAADGKPVLDKIGLANDRPKLVIAQGGDTKKGVVYLLVD